MFDPVAHIFISGCGDRAHHLFQMRHAQVGMGPLPPPDRRGLAGLFFGRLSVHLSQVGALRFGQLALCQRQKTVCLCLQLDMLASRNSCLFLGENYLPIPYSEDIEREGRGPSGMAMSLRKLGPSLTQTPLLGCSPSCRPRSPTTAPSHTQLGAYFIS